MIDVDDEVVDFEVAQVREERLGRGATAFRRAAFLFEDVGFGPDLQSGVGRRNPRDRPLTDEHRRVAHLPRALDRNGKDVGVLEQLDRPLGAAGSCRHEERRLAVVPEPADFRHPVRDAAAHLDRRLTTNAMRGQGIGTSAGFGIWDSGFVSSSNPSCSRFVAVARRASTSVQWANSSDGDGASTTVGRRPGTASALQVRPLHQQIRIVLVSAQLAPLLGGQLVLFVAGVRAFGACRIRVAALDLLEQFEGVRFDLVQFRDDYAPLARAT